VSALLSVRDLTVGIGAARPVDGVSFDIAAGETFALLGESGCGKSMTALALMRLLPGAARVLGGSVSYRGDELLALPERAMRAVRGAGLGMVFQEPATSLNPVLTVGRQIDEVFAAHAVDVDPTRAQALLAAVGIPDPQRRLGEFPFQLSGGMKQRVMIAMALAGAPQLLIADEPTTALDVTIQAQVLDLLRALQRERGMAMLLISHDLGVVAGMADRIGVMYAGQLVEVASRADFYARPAHPYSRRLFAALPDLAARGARLATIPGNVPRLDAPSRGCRFASRCAEVMAVCHAETPPWRRFGNDRALRCHLPPEAAVGVVAVPAASSVQAAADAAPAAPLLAVTDLKVHFPIRRGILRRTVGQVRAVDGVSLSIAPGQTLALVGESGCGKTTVGKAVMRLIAPTAGTVAIDGIAVSDARLSVLRASLQMVFQDPFGSLNPRLRIGPIIEEGLKTLGVAGDVGDLLEQVGLTRDMAGRYPHEFSGGQRQRIAIARALAVRPRLVILDEPTSALDVSVQAQILNLLADLRRSHNLAYLFITHNIAVVDYLADRVAVMYLGRIVESGSADAVLRSPRHPYTQALLAAVPRIDGAAGERIRVIGDPPSPAAPPPGCHFNPRCPRADARCREVYPLLADIAPQQQVACHYPG
jgi:peptide/nickel transport system ATP-binding protein